MKNLVLDIKKHLKIIKNIYGVENVVLTQRDGQPIESSGVWLSKNEIFGVCSSTSAIFNVAELLHKDCLNYILIDGKRAKILITPIYIENNTEIFNQNSNRAEFFIAITTRPQVNLGGIFIKLKKKLEIIGKIISESKYDFKPPLRSFSEKEIENILNSFSVKNQQEIASDKFIDTFTFKLDISISNKIRDVVFDFSKNVPGVNLAIVALNGGYSLCKFSLDPLIDSEGALPFSLFDTSRRIIWMLKKTEINNVLCDCKKYNHFTYGLLKGSIFSTYISKNNEKRLGLLRLMIPQYVNSLQSYLQEASKKSIDSFDINQLLEELNL
ncbi:MAG: hypothetical protein EAX96_09730 [Candidatus Lokiarchaeota archaeon]|nr:hypothetical protein [Candidatus Lokiarchaeota archaeon]